MHRKKTFEQALETIVRRTVATAQPSQIMLLGPAALEAVGPHSDLGLLVVVRKGRHRGKTAQKIYRSVMGLGYVADIVVVTETDVATLKNNVGTLLHSALTDGRVLYDARSQ